MKKNYQRLIIVVFMMFISELSQAQMSGPNAFIKGDFVEIGVSLTGAFGAGSTFTGPPPAGYHPNVPAWPNCLGFVSDPDKDGWLVSAPGSAAYMGDYFVPGTPYEGWDLKAGGTTYSYRNQPSTGTCPGSTCANISYTATTTEQTTVWQGTAGNLTITQKTVVKKDKLYFVMFVDIVNTGTTTINSVYYSRSVDPDNEQPWTGSFVTVNRIVFQPNAISKNCLVTANGQTYSSQSYLGLGTKDCRAKCYILNSGLSTSAQLDDIYNQTSIAAPFLYNVAATSTNDVGYGLVYNLGNLAAGQKTSLAYTYILKQADLDSALGETAPKFESAGAPYAPFSTFRVCPGKTVPLKVINGGQYQWIWTTTALPNYLTAPGSTTLVAAGGTIPTVTGTKVYPYGAVFGDSCVVTVFGPRTYTATGISNCDTQTLTFYVDTINFSVPPSVTSPVRYCEGATPVALTAGAAAGATLNWYTVGTGGVSSPTAPTPSTAFPPTSTDFDTTSYWVSQTNVAGCETPRSRINVIVTKKPAPPGVTNLVYCVGDTTNALTAMGSNLKWFDATTGGTQYPSTPTPSSAKTGLTSYFPSQTINGCESDRAQLDVEISQVIAAFTKSEDSLCGSELLTLTNNSTTSSAGSYVSKWSLGDGASSTDSNTTHNYQDARGTYTINLVVTNVNGCKDSVQQKVEVFKEPVIEISASDTIVCQGGSVDFEGEATPGYRALAWDFGDGDPAYNSLQVRHAFTKSGLFDVKLNGTYPACPGTGSGIKVNVIPIPNVNLGPDSGICPGNTALVLRNLNPAPVGKYIWNTGDTSATIQVRNAGQYTLTAQNWKCSASDSITISKACYFDVPSAFTPGSGNDYTAYFIPRSLLSKSIVTFNMQIFDRWGQKIFESDKIDGRGWDGNHNGQAMPMGVYVYLIRVSFANVVSENYNGNVTLLR
jgi:gliding motility-associated-like protein